MYRVREEVTFTGERVCFFVIAIREIFVDAAEWLPTAESLNLIFHPGQGHGMARVRVQMRFAQSIRVLFRAYPRDKNDTLLSPTSVGSLEFEKPL